MFIGSCSWKYSEWESIVYSPDCKNYLEEYSRFFSTVEIDQWFWSLFDNSTALPDSAVALDYVSSVPEDFRFTIKLPDSLSLTHYRNRKGEKSLRINPNFLSLEFLEKTLHSLKHILPQTLVLMLQFEYLNKQKMSDNEAFFDVLEDFLQNLASKKAISGPPWFGVEIRNANYLGSRFFSLLGDYQVTPVLIHGYYMPSVDETVKKYLSDIGRDAPVVLRIHGPERKEMDRLTGKRWDKLVRPMDEDIVRIGNAVKLLESKGIETVINVNNHFEGCAPLSITRLLEHI